MRSTTRYLAWRKYHIAVWERAVVAGNAHVLYILKAVPQVADKRVINMLKHAALSYDISHAFGPDDCMVSRMSATMPEADFAGLWVGLRTFIFADILQGKRQVGVFPFNDAYFAKGSSADDSQQSKVVEVYYLIKRGCQSNVQRQRDDAQARGRSNQGGSKGRME